MSEISFFAQKKKLTKWQASLREGFNYPLTDLSAIPQVFN